MPRSYNFCDRKKHGDESYLISKLIYEYNPEKALEEERKFEVILKKLDEKEQKFLADKIEKLIDRLEGDDSFE